jgi:hypothetical protein
MRQVALATGSASWFDVLGADPGDIAELDGKTVAREARFEARMCSRFASEGKTHGGN